MYATLAQVQALIPELPLDATSKPTDTEVEGIIAQASGEIDGILRAQGYETVPATGDTDAAILGGQVARYAAAQSLLAGYTGNDAPYKVKAWLEGFEGFMGRLRRGEQRLVDQEPTSSLSGFIEAGFLTFEEWVD